MVLEYGKVHRYFLRNIMSRGVLTEQQARKIIHTCSNEHQEVSEIVSEINSRICPYAQEIKHVRHELTGEYNYVIVWKGLGEAALSQNLHSEQELLFWKKLLEEIVTSDGKKVDAIDALNLCRDMNTITKIRAQELMDEWTTTKYLEKIDEGSYILGIRGICEFDPYLHLHFQNTMDICTLCTMPVFQGTKCSHCDHYFHKYCLITAKRKMKVWPCCKNDYTETPEDAPVEIACDSPAPLAGGGDKEVSSDDQMDMSQEY